MTNQNLFYKLYRKGCYLLLLLTIQINANDTITVSSRMYHTDTVKKLILVNQSLIPLNASIIDHSFGIQLNDYYSFESPVNELKIGTAYNVQNTLDSIYKIYFTQLPIVNIHTNNEVVNEPRVFAQFQLTDSTGATISSNIGIEYRGGFSQRFWKRSFRIEFWNDTIGDSKKNVSLLGMRNDDDWNLQALYVEPLRLRNKSLFNLWSEMDSLKYIDQEPNAKNEVSIEYVEVFFNNEYQGIFAISERIDRKQLKLKKPENGRISGELYKMKEAEQATRFLSVPDFDNTSLVWDGYIYKHPVEIIDWTNLHSFTDFFVNASDEDFYANYHTIIDEENTINYFLFIAVINAMDNQARNIYIARYDSLSQYIFLPWDFDATMGLDVLGYGSLERQHTIIASSFFDRLLLDDAFLYKLKLRWEELRKGPVTYEHIISLFEPNYNCLKRNGVYERENIAWKWYQYDESDWDFIKQWTASRLVYLDDYFDQISPPVTISKSPNEQIAIYPNPATNKLYLKGFESPDVSVIFYNLQGKRVYHHQMTSSSIDISFLPKGIYVVKAIAGANSSVTKLIKE